MAAKTLATYISELSAVTSLGAGDKIPVLESSTVKYVEGNGLGQASDADLTTIAGLTPADDDFLQRKAGAWANRTVSQVKTDLGVPTYARYVALLTQTGTDAPVATVLENTLGGTVVWSYGGVGSYTGTLASAFTANKTTITCSQSSIGVVICGRDNDDEVYILATDSSFSDADDQINGSVVEIRVYP